MRYNSTKHGNSTENSDSTVTSSRRNVLTSVGTITISGLSAALFGSELVLGSQPEPLKNSQIEWSNSEAPGEVFPLSVLSGGPTESGAILWTKLAEEAYNSSEPGYVQVAKDEEFSDPIYEGRIQPKSISSENNCVIKVDLDGELPSNQHLHYRFHYNGTTSQTGRCRTLPNPTASPDQIALAVVSCQLFQHGYYPAYNYIADDDVDYILHLGDQIYEYGDPAVYEPYRDFADRSIELPSGHDIAWNLEDFRHLWETYRNDEFYQRALERHTLIPTWDDHEFVNNPYWDYENDRPWSDHHPKNDDEEFMTQLFIDAIKAWWEYNPARVEYNPRAEHLQDRFHMWRSITFGDLLELPVTDERLFRSLPPGGDDAGQREWGIPPYAPERDDGNRTMLGFEQREWFLKTLRETDATWKAWANEVAFSEMLMPRREDDDQIARNYDAWDGYEHERKEIIGHLSHFEVDNFVTLTGDWHTYLAAYLPIDYEDAEKRTPIPSQESLIGIEFMTPAISSNSWASDSWGKPDMTSVESDSPELTNEKMTETILRENPYINFFNGKYNGYSVIEFTPKDCTWTTYAVDSTINEPDATRQLLRKYRIPKDRVELQELEANNSLK